MHTDQSDAVGIDEPAGPVQDGHGLNSILITGAQSRVCHEGLSVASITRTSTKDVTFLSEHFQSTTEARYKYYNIYVFARELQWLAWNAWETTSNVTDGEQVFEIWTKRPTETYDIGRQNTERNEI